MKIKKSHNNWERKISLRIAVLVLLISDYILENDKYTEKSMLIHLDHSATLNMID